MPLIEPVAQCRKFNALSRHAQWFYLQLKTLLDAAGRHDAHPAILNSTLFPLRKDVRDTDISRWLLECKSAGLLRCYVDTKGRAVVEVFDARQSRMKSIKSNFDPPEGQVPLFPEATAKAEPGKERKGKEENKPDASAGAGAAKIGDVIAPSKGASAGIMALVETRLNELYRRKPTDRWTYAEQTALLEVCRRPDAWEELEHILAWRRSMPTEDRKRFFAQSVHTLLSRWTECLDKARIQCPLKNEKSKSGSPEKPGATRRAETHSAATLKESIAYLERENPKSSMLPMLRKQLETLTADGGR